MEAKRMRISSERGCWIGFGMEIDGKKFFFLSSMKMQMWGWTTWVYVYLYRCLRRTLYLNEYRVKDGLWVDRNSTKKLRFFALGLFSTWLFGPMASGNYFDSSHAKGCGTGLIQVKSRMLQRRLKGRQNSAISLLWIFSSTQISTVELLSTFYYWIDGNYRKRHFHHDNCVNISKMLQH